jgi:hypothetical protein
MDGWVKLHRKIQNNGWLTNPELLTFWIWCLTKATHKSVDLLVGRQKVHLEPGQFVFGRKQAAEELKQHESRIYRHMAYLRDIEQSIHITSNNKFSIISIINWASYQGEPGEPEQQPEQQSEHPANTNKKYKEEAGKEHPANPLPKITKKPKTYTITYNPETNLFDGITMEEIKLWERAYSLVNIRDALHDMCVKIPGRYDTYKDWKRFITSWLSKEQKSQRAKMGI